MSPDRGSAATTEGEARHPVVTATCRDLVTLTWIIDPSTVRPLLAAGTELDLYDGEALVSVVAFAFRELRVKGVRFPFHTDFEQVSLRFYVRRKLADGTWRRGVTLVKEIVPRRLIATTARSMFGEPYESHPMHHAAIPEAPLTEQSGDGTRSLVYEWKREDEWERVIALLTSPPRPIRGDSIEEFVSAPYWGYSGRGAGHTLEYQVEHERWRITPVSDCFLEADVPSLYGRRFADALSAAPISTFVAEGSPVFIYPGQTLAL